MKNLTLIMIAVWSFIGLAIIAAMIGFTIYNNDKERSFTPMIFGEVDTSDMQIVSEGSVPMNEIKRIELELFSDVCNIYFTDSDNIEMKHYARNVPESQYAIIRVLDSTLNISTKPRGVNGFISFGIMRQSVVDILLPASYRDALSVNLSSGNIRFYDNARLSELSVKVSSGTIRTEHAIETQNLDIIVTSGTVKLTGGVKADRYTLKTSSGNLTVDNHLIGSGSVNVTSGTVKLFGTDITEALDIKVSSGNVTVGVAGNPSLSFNGKTSSGTVRTYFDTDKNGKTLSATIGGGPYKNLDVNVTSGTISIKQN